MDACYRLLLVLLLAGVCSSEKIFATRPSPGKPQNVSKNDTEVKKAVLIATYSFNNKSNDVFFFKASAIDEAQRQIVKGIKYILKIEISRTVCKKREADTDLAKCNFQPKRQLQQSTFHEYASILHSANSQPFSAITFRGLLVEGVDRLLDNCQQSSLCMQ